MIPGHSYLAVTLILTIAGSDLSPALVLACLQWLWVILAGQVSPGCTSLAVALPWSISDPYRAWQRLIMSWIWLVWTL